MKFVIEVADTLDWHVGIDFVKGVLFLNKVDYFCIYNRYPSGQSRDQNLVVHKVKTFKI